MDHLALWIRVWDILTHVHAVREVGGSNPDRVFFPSNQATGKIFSIEYVIYCKLLIDLELVPMVNQ